MAGPEVIAHRGQTGRYAENTLNAFGAAIAAGADAIELDVHASADNILVVHHDPVLRSGSGGPGTPIRTLSVARMHNEMAIGKSVPTLEEVLQMVAGTVKLYVEVKAPGIEALVCDALRGAESWCALHSFDHRIVATVRELAPTISRGVLLCSYLVDSIAPLRDTSARDLWEQYDLIDAELVRRVHDYGGRVIAWTVNDTDDAQTLIAWGVDGICTDRCDVMRTLVGPSRPMHISPP
jgi:glycerophosphoryl diester phosphodiesterase